MIIKMIASLTLLVVCISCGMLPQLLPIIDEEVDQVIEFEQDVKKNENRLRA
jgi:hypothetical protein